MTILKKRKNNQKILKKLNGLIEMNLVKKKTQEAWLEKMLYKEPVTGKRYQSQSKIKNLFFLGNPNPKYLGCINISKCPYLHTPIFPHTAVNTGAKTKSL